MRKPAEAPSIQAHDGHRGPPKDRKKMAIVGAVYDAQPQVRTAEQVLQSLFRGPLEPKAPAEAAAAQKNKPIAKAVRASLTQAAANDGEINARDVIFPWLGEQVCQRDPAGLSRWWRSWMGRSACGAMPRRCWASGPGWKSWISCMSPKSCGNWPISSTNRPNTGSGWMGMSFYSCRGQARGLTAWFRHEAKTRPLSSADRRKVEAVCGYFEKNWERMRYDEYLAAGYPIASGVIEGACRHVVKDRLERTGMHWTVAGAQAMLQLRCIAINQQWDDFTAFRVRRESERLYPQTTLYEVEDWPIPQAA